jgi:hypothetical protein
MSTGGGIQNIPDWCRHLYSSCVSAKHRSQHAKLWIPGSTATFCGDCMIHAKTSPRTLARIDLAASTWQRSISQFHPHPAVSGETKNDCHPHTPYSHDLVPCDFFLFPEIKLKLKGRQFNTIEEVQAESPRVLHTLTAKDYQEAFQKWRRRWDQCLHAEGNYFKGDGGR